MAFDVRLFAHRGVSQIRHVAPKQFATDAIYVLEQPYEWRQKLTTNGAAPVSSAPDNTATVTLLRIEVPDGQAIRIEINPPSRSVVASADSPIMQGINNFAFSPGWTISIVEA